MNTTLLSIATSAILACLTLIPTSALAAAPKTVPATVYVAHLHGLNSEIIGSHPAGIAHFVVRGNKLTIRIQMRGVPPGIAHWQHLHGFTDGQAATCPIGRVATEAADKNHDGIIDLIETEPDSGTTMVPFNANPVAMDIPANTYPRASVHGTYTYKKRVSIKALQAMFAKTFNSASLDLDKRVVYIHGVPANTKLPASVASLGAIPAQVTLPIACGKIERVASR